MDGYGRFSTFLRRPPPLVQLQGLLVLKLLHRRVAPGPRQRDLHRLVEEIKPVGLLDGAARRVGVVVDYERLALRLEVRLGHDVDDVSELGEDGVQGLLQGLGLDALLDVADIDTVRRGDKGTEVSFLTWWEWILPSERNLRPCRGAMTRTW